MNFNADGEHLKITFIKCQVSTHQALDCAEYIFSRFNLWEDIKWERIHKMISYSKKYFNNYETNLNWLNHIILW